MYLIRFVTALLCTLLSAQHAAGQVNFEAQTTEGCTPLGINIQVTAPSASSISSYAWTILTPSGTTLLASTSSYVAIFTEAGSYSVTLTINGGTTLTRSNYINVYARPIAQLAADDAEGCFPLCVQFTDASTAGSAPLTSWNWDFGNGTTSTQQHPQNCYPTTGVFTPVLSVSDANGCFASTNAPQLVNVRNTFPNAQFEATTSLTCTPPELIGFTNSSTGNTALTSSWSFGDGGTSNLASGVQHSYSETGTFSVCLTVTDAIGCTDEVCEDIVLFDQPTVSITQAPATACAGSNYTFAGTSLPAGATLQWDFNNDGEVDATGSSVSYSFESTGQFTPTLTAVYSSSCEATATGSAIEVTPGLALTIAADTTVGCATPFPVNFTALSSVAGSSYTWSIDNQSFSGSTVPYTFQTYGQFSIGLTATSPNGCTAALQENNYIQLSPPSIQFNHPPAACVGLPVSTSNLTLIPSSSDYSLDWDFNSDGVVDATGINPSYTYTATGNYSIVVTATHPNGCSVTFEHPSPISVVQSVETTITTSTTTSCAGEAIEFCVNSAPGNQFSWNFHDGTGWFTMGADETCITHDYQDTGYFHLSLTVFNGVCNTSQEWENYIYITPPVALFDYNLNCDNPLSVDFGDLSIEADQLIWNFGDGSSEVTNDATPTHLFPGPGEYDVTLTAINSALGCPDIAQTTVVVQEASPALLFQSSEGCPPVAVAISNTIDNVYWNIQISNGDSLIMQRSIATGVWTAHYYAGEQLTTLITANGQNHWPQLTFSEAGCYDFEVYSTDANGCNSTHTYHDVVCVGTDSNFGNFQTTVVSACDPFEVEFNTTVSGISSWMWTFSDGSQATGNPVSHTFLPPFSPNAPLSATLTAVNTGGCTSVVTQPIVAAMPITPSFHTSGSPVCKNEEISFTNTTTGSATSFTWSFGDGQTGTGTNAVHSYSQNGIYEVCLTADNGAGCLQTTCTMAGATVASPEASFTHTSSITNCLFGVNFENTSQGAIDELMWIFGDGQTGSVNETYHTYSIGVYNVMLVASNQFGCVDTSVVIDIFNYGDIIGPYTALLDTTPCAPFGVDFSAFNPSDNYFTYFWDFNDGSGDPTGATQTQHDYLEPGVYCPSVILTDPDGCQMFISCEEPIVVEEFITTNLYEPSICAGETTLFTATGADHYVWNTSPFISTAGTSNTFVLTPPTSTSFLLTSTLDDCVRVDTIHVQVNPLPAVSLSMPDFVCYSAPDIALTTGLPVGTSGYYTVNGEVGTFFNTNQLPNAAYEVSYTFSDSLGCTNTSTEEVWIAPLPEITFSTFEGICANESALLLEHAAPAGGVYTFQADTISYFDPSGHLGLQALNYHFTDANGCSNSESFTIPVYAAPVPVVSIPSVCEDLPFVAFSASTLAEGTITSTEWQLDGGAWTNDNPFTPTFTPAVGLHSIRLRLESDMGCISESDSTFSVWPIPEPSFATENGCQFSSLPLVANSTVVSGEIERYLWLVEGETYEDDDSLDYEFQTWGTQSVSLINITENGCDDTLSLTMMVYPAPVIDLVVENACEGAITYLDSQVSLPLGGIVQHIWNLGDGTTEPSMPAIDHIFSENGTYTISYTAQSNLNCTSTSTTELIIHDTPEVDFAIIDSTVCVETELELVDMSSVDPLQEITHWNWYLDDLQLSTTQNPVVDYPLVGHYSLRLEVFTNNGCTADSIQPYAVFIMPKPEAGMRVVRDELTMSAPVVDIKNESSLDVSSWYYTLGDGTTATSEDVRHAYSSWGNYSISQIVTNAFGCTDTTTDRVSVDSEVLVYVPNAFTPDGNGNNDGFKPVLSGFEIDMYFLKIVNRWGQVVFETKDPELYWNGDYNNVGAQALDGAYTWQLDLKTTDSPVIQRQAGTVVLLR